MLTLILIVNFQARQTQEAASSGAKVDEHIVTRCMLGERRGHQRVVGRILKGIGSSSSTAVSHAYFTAGSLSVHPSYEELAAARAESQMYKERLDAMKMNVAHLVAQLWSRMPDLQYPGPFPQYTQPDLNAEEEDEEEEAEDQNLGDD